MQVSGNEEGRHYINANYILGYSGNRDYIATQAPTVASLDDFWACICEQNITLIVMLTSLSPVDLNWKKIIEFLLIQIIRMKKGNLFSHSYFELLLQYQIYFYHFTAVAHLFDLLFNYT